MASVRIDKGIHAVSFILVFVSSVLLQPLGPSIQGICKAHGLCIQIFLGPEHFCNLNNSESTTTEKLYRIAYS